MKQRIPTLNDFINERRKFMFTDYKVKNIKELPGKVLALITIPTNHISAEQFEDINKKFKEILVTEFGGQETTYAYEAKTGKAAVSALEKAIDSINGVILYGHATARGYMLVDKVTDEILLEDGGLLNSTKRAKKKLNL